MHGVLYKLHVCIASNYTLGMCVDCIQCHVYIHGLSFSLTSIYCILGSFVCACLHLTYVCIILLNCINQGK